MKRSIHDIVDITNEERSSKRARRQIKQECPALEKCDESWMTKDDQKNQEINIIDTEYKSCTKTDKNDDEFKNDGNDVKIKKEKKEEEEDTTIPTHAFTLKEQIVARNLAESFLETTTLPINEFATKLEVAYAKLMTQFGNIDINITENIKNELEHDFKKNSLLTNIGINLKLNSKHILKKSNFDRFRPSLRLTKQDHQKNRIKILMYHFMEDPSLMRPLRIFLNENKYDIMELSHNSKTIHTKCLFENCEGHFIGHNKKSKCLLFTSKNGPQHISIAAKRCNKCDSTFKNCLIKKKGKMKECENDDQDRNDDQDGNNDQDGNGDQDRNDDQNEKENQRQKKNKTNYYPGDIYFLNPDKSKYIEKSTATCFEIKLLMLFGFLTLKEGNGGASYAEHYNMQFEEEIDILTNEHLARRKQNEEKGLKANILSDCFYYYAALRLIFKYKLYEDDENKDDNLKLPHIKLPGKTFFELKLKHKIQRRLMSKEKKFDYKSYGGKVIDKIIPECDKSQLWNLIEFDEEIGYSNGVMWGRNWLQHQKRKGYFYMFIKQKECTKNGTDTNNNKSGVTDNEIYFKYLFDTFLRKKIWSLSNVFGEVILTNDSGKPEVKACQIYGDGNQKLTNILCNCPDEINKFLNYDLRKLNLSTLRRSQAEYHQCENAAYNGNQDSVATTLCLPHYLTLKLTSRLNDEDIQSFVNYFNIKQSLSTSSSTKNKEILTNKMNQIRKSKQMMFDEIHDTYEQLAYMEQRRKECHNNGLIIGDELIDLQTLRTDYSKNFDRSDYGV